MYLREDPILTDLIELYELVVPERRVSDRRLQRYQQHDEVYAFQLVLGLNVEEHQWPQLVGPWLHEPSDHNHTLYRQVARLIIRGVIQLYRLPACTMSATFLSAHHNHAALCPSLLTRIFPFRQKRKYSTRWPRLRLLSMPFNLHRACSTPR